TILAEERRPLDPRHEYREGLALASAVLRDLTAELGAVRRVCLGLPAPLAEDVVRANAILPGWEGVAAREEAEREFGVPVQIENDANLGALAEHREGLGRHRRTSVFVKISSGVGAGIIIDNALFRGASGSAGEIGHLTLDDQGPLCRCGSRGCLEAYTAVYAVQKMLADQLPGASLDDIIDAANRDNLSARRALEDAGLHLGWGLANVVNILNPAVVVIGGDMARAGDLVLEAARLGLRRHALDSVATTPVLAGALGERASLVGAVLQAAEHTDILAPSGSVG
ncbi:MAG: ROK family protein, partial [Nocardioides sp.]